MLAQSLLLSIVLSYYYHGQNSFAVRLKKHPRTEPAKIILESNFVVIRNEAAPCINDVLRPDSAVLDLGFPKSVVQALGFQYPIERFHICVIPALASFGTALLSL